MNLSKNAIIENYKERVHRLALFDSLYRLENKKTKDNKGNYIDFFGLGLLTLLFFFENMLIRNKKVGTEELAKFLYEINQDELDLDYKDFEKISRTIIDNFRPPGGKRNFKSFYNWEKRQEEIVEYSILKASKSDVKTNTQYYTLDEQGLELIFATKEYFSEFQLSINQLLLRKQLEKGEFVGAIRQIDEMRVDVETLEERIIKIKHEVQRNILSEKTYERYKVLIDDINIRLKRENEEFDQLSSFISETRDKLSYDIRDEKDTKAYEYIIKIQKELGNVHKIHRTLLQKSIELKTTTLQSAQESLYYIGMDSFNFNSEIVSRLFSSPLPLESSRMLINPLLYIEKAQIWSPLTVFSPQKIRTKNEEEKTNEFLDIKDKEEIAEEVELQQDNFKFITKVIIEALDKKQNITLEELITYIKTNGKENLLNNLLFYHFFLILHQKSPLDLTYENAEKEVLLKKVIEMLNKKYSRLIVWEIKGVIHISERFHIKNMIIELEGI